MALGVAARRSISSTLESPQTGENCDAHVVGTASVPTIPAVLPQSSSPLPILPMTVLSIMMLGEFLSSNVSVPFLIFMVKGFGFPDEADAAFWTGILVAAFFLSQFLTSLLWATLAEQYGRRIVLVVALFGSAMSVTAFGLSKTIWQAISIRLVQGVFAGAVGVARGSVVSITDASNEGRAYAILGFFWGFGGLLGPIIGGSFEHPSERWPVFDQWKFFEQFPYFLPTAVAGLILLVGSFLACYLSRDGGQTEISVPVPVHPEKLEEDDSSFSVEQRLRPLSRVTSIENESQNQNTNAFPTSDFWRDTSRSTPISSGIPIGPRTLTVCSSKSIDYSTFGGTSRFAPRPKVFHSLCGGLSESLPTMAMSCSTPGDADTRSIADRVVLANENAVNNIADLWVTAAIKSQETCGSGGEIQPDGDESARHLEEGLITDDQTSRGRTSLRLWKGNSPATRRHTNTHSLTASRCRQSRCTSVARSILTQLDGFFNDQTVGETTYASPRPIPSIFTNPGVSTPPAVMGPVYSETDLMVQLDRDLSPILEARLPSALRLDESQESTPLVGLDIAPSSSSLPLSVIIQFGLLALHSTTHDQVFMSYLVSDYSIGGLGLSASDFAQLIALMGFAQIIYQFYLYPPPRGQLSHLTMYRLGTFLFILSYLTVVLYRAFAQPEHYQHSVLMTALAISTAIRYCGITFAFTSVSVLLNYMTPPEKIGYANGLAQTIVSLARCLGPVFGGYIWSASVDGHPSGYPCGFVVCTILSAIALITTIFMY
ncbi:hypothetical protein FB446DRAFT_644542 [Lentinula raphanica]|nr:hypothetical protein FB446DRAFT_644542 [Lentinula raphanica]